MKQDSQPFEPGDRDIVTREFNSATFNYTPIKQFFNPLPPPLPIRDTGRFNFAAFEWISRLTEVRSLDCLKI